MDEFNFYNQLCVLSDIAAQYSEGKAVSSEVRADAEEISSHLYRVAVIGEFKRGKSSLINALIGASVLPTDVIPLTAAITRLTYGTKQMIIVSYKDGHSEEKTLDELIDYATKYDQEREKTAESVREIEVKYPSVLCKNHIEILDTPGLNDNESMSEVTLSVLGEIDAAIVVISATKPLSLTEQNLILDLIRQDGIRHLVFAVTFLDTLGDEEEKDRMLSFIRGRIQKELLGRAEKAAEDNSVLLKKARGILSSPDLFGVSSRQAMQGFTNDDRKLLKESRFPVFKEELLALLTAAQSEDIPPKVEQITRMVESALPGWREHELRLLAEQETEAQRRRQTWQFYIEHSKGELTQAFQRMDAALAKKGLSPSAGLESAGLERMLVKCFVKRLSTLTQENTTHEAIARALQSAKQEAEQELNKLERSLSSWVREEMGRVLDWFVNLRRMVELSDWELERELHEFDQRPFPPFSWTEEPIPKSENLRGVNVIETVKRAVHRSLTDYGAAVNQYIAHWRIIFIHRNAEDRNTAGILESMDAVLENVTMRRGALEFNYLRHMEKIRDIRQNAASAGGTVREQAGAAES